MFASAFASDVERPDACGCGCGAPLRALEVCFADSCFAWKAAGEILGGRCRRGATDASTTEPEEVQMSAADDFDAVIEPYHEALRAIINGDPSGYKAMYSQGEDVTLANPFGGVARGRAQVEERLDRAAATFRDGEIVGFETITKSVTSELAYLVEVERPKAKVAGSDELTPTDIRVTTVFRPEAGTWKVVHRHADPAVGAQPPNAVFQR
jgi:ketosteroid isomerase-like protein